MTTRWTLTARWVFPVETPPLERGLVTIAGERIAAVEPHGTRHADVDLGNVAVLPGFVNAHTHLDLSGMRGLSPPSLDFSGWLRQVIAFRRERSPEQIRADLQTGIAECLRFGTTLIGDVSGDGGSWVFLANNSLRAVVFREFLGLPKDRASGALDRLIRWHDSQIETTTCRRGVSPHAPYSVRSSLFYAASIIGVPVAVHLAETTAEQELLVLRRGPFVGFLRDLDAWEPDGLAEDTDHVLRLLNGTSPTLLIHCNYLPADSVIPDNACIVYCPRTHAAFGHSPHPFRDFLKRGIRVAIGTDSLASNPDLDVLSEIRFVHKHFPDVLGLRLLYMATLSGAHALAWADETGSLAKGKSADLVVLPLPNREEADPHQLILESDLPVTKVMWRGSWLTTNHP